MAAMPVLIKENPQIQPCTKHDQLYKQLTHIFFKEFLEAFFPEVHEYLDFHTIKLMSEGAYTCLIEGKNCRRDIVVETKLKD